MPSTAKRSVRDAVMRLAEAQMKSKGASLARPRPRRMFSSVQALAAIASARAACESVERHDEREPVNPAGVRALERHPYEKEHERG